MYYVLLSVDVKICRIHLSFNFFNLSNVGSTSSIPLPLSPVTSSQLEQFFTSPAGVDMLKSYILPVTESTAHQRIAHNKNLIKSAFRSTQSDYVLPPDLFNSDTTQSDWYHSNHESRFDSAGPNWEQWKSQCRGNSDRNRNPGGDWRHWAVLEVRHTR